MKIEIGGGRQPAPGFTNIDIATFPEVDIVGDVRAIFTPDVDIAAYPALERFQEPEIATHIRAIHFVEHVPWIYQQAMFGWFWTLLQSGGSLEVATPNFRYIVQVYLKRRGWSIQRFFSRLRGQTVPLFPDTDHALIETNRNAHDLTLWTNYKIFSGCGLGDYHHCGYDKTLMEYMLSKQTWKTVCIHEKKETLFIQANKAPEKDPFI